MTAPNYRDRIAELTRQGLTAPQIADIIGCTKRTVHRARTAHGIARPTSPPMSDAEIAYARRLLEDGASYFEAARTVGRDPQTIRKHLPGYGWTRRECVEYATMLRKLRPTEAVL